MTCRRCGGQPMVPWERPGLPTIRAFGPFPDHEPVPVTPPVGEQDSE